MNAVLQLGYEINLDIRQLVQKHVITRNNLIIQS